MFVLELLAAFLIILAGNQAGYAGRWDWPLGKSPVSIVHLGPNKTWSSYYAGPMFGVVAAVVLAAFEPVRVALSLETAGRIVTVGCALGLGAVLGDHANSFAKRLIGIPAGASFPTDRIDWVLAGGIAALIHVPTFTWMHLLVLVAIGYPIHVYGNRHSHRRGWRKTPH